MHSLNTSNLETFTVYTVSVIMHELKIWTFQCGRCVGCACESVNQNAVGYAVCLCTVVISYCLLQIEPHQFYCCILYLYIVVLVY